uniref:Ig-like domain-containing protein n=1 Tax=Oreochromis niloticus TaxID=8128 RepID=A0A669B9P0_ORENI
MLPLNCVFLLPSGQDEVQVEAGADATLDCQGLTEGTITVLAWNKRGMNSVYYVFFYREDRPYNTFQHPSFQGRVELGDPQLKGGNMSIILHNTTVNDTGTYECHISYQSGSGRDKRVIPEIISETSLKVVPTGESEASKINVTSYRYHKTFLEFEKLTNRWLKQAQNQSIITASSTAMDSKNVGALSC